MMACKLRLILTLALLVGNGFANAADDEKKYYGAIDPAVRLNLIGHMRVKKTFPAPAGAAAEDDKDNQIAKIDVVGLLREKCGFDYRRDSAGNPLRPQVECRYTPKPAEDGFNGMTSKFDCTFEPAQAGAKARTLKVKYDDKKRPGGGYKEIPQAVMGTLMARLMGFYTNTYCPVDLICNDCPSDHPWAQKSQAPAAAGSRVVFENVVVEVKQKGPKIIDRRHVNAEKPQGFSFADEMARYAPRNAALQAQLLTEREALALWQNFILAKDADRHNNKLICARSRNVPGSNPVCELSVGFINDYGNGFGYSGSDPLNLSAFSTHALSTSGGRAVARGAAGNSGASGYIISKAGRDLFVSMAGSLTEDQLRDIFLLAQIDKTSNAGVEQWVQAYLRKVQGVRDTRIR